MSISDSYAPNNSPGLSSQPAELFPPAPPPPPKDQWLTVPSGPAKGRAIHSKHLAHLRDSALSSETLLAAGFYTEPDAKEITKLINWKDWNHGPVLVIPFFDLSGQQTFCRVRPDKPIKLGEREAKYLQPAKTPVQAYFPPIIAREKWLDASTDIYITEGEKKALCISEHIGPCIGLTGVDCWGRRGELLPELAALPWTGRSVYIVYDSDAANKPEVKKAEQKLAKALHHKQANVHIVRLPDDGESGKKLGADDFIAKHGAEAFSELVRAADPLVIVGGGGGGGKKSKNRPQSSSALARTTGRERIDLHAELALVIPEDENGEPKKKVWNAADEAGLFLRESDYKYIHQADQWYEYSKGIYAPISKQDMAKSACLFISGRSHFNSSSNCANDLLLNASALVSVASDVTAPAWLPDRMFFAKPEEAKPVPFTAAGAVVVGNGVISLPQLMDGKPCITPHDPRLFATWKLPFDFDQNAPNPDLWIEFLHEAFSEGDETEDSQIDALQEWFGYVLSGDVLQQKMLMLIGPPGSGKGVICDVLTQLLGCDNVSSITTASLSERFGLSHLATKPLAILPDARVSGRDDQSKIVESLLSIVGNDSIFIDRKNRDPVTVRLRTRLVWTSNEVPMLNEPSRAIVRRLLLLRTKQSFEGREDRDLLAKLKPELPGILLWAVEGYRRLLKRKRFLQPQAGRNDLDDLRKLGSPIPEFIEECCDLEPDAFASIDDLFVAYRAWATEGGRPVGHKQILSTKLAAAGYERGRPGGDGPRPRGFFGLTVRPGWLIRAPK